MSTNCLVHACQALVVGIVLFSIGACMSTLGFHADGLLDPNNNSTEEDVSYYYTGEGRTTVRFSKLSYAGPIVMGIGGFIIVATCVMTFEARDSAAKVGPASYSGVRNSAAVYSNTYRARTRSLDVRSVASQTMPESHTTSVTALHIFDKKALLETFKKFSRTIRTGSTSKDEEDQFHRSPSAPSLLETDLPSDTITTSTSKSRSRRYRDAPNPNQDQDQGVTGSSSTSGSTSNVTNVSGNRGLRRSSILTRHRPRIPPALKHLRQAMSVDCPSTSPFILHTVTGTSTGTSTSGNYCATASSTTSGGSSKLNQPESKNTTTSTSTTTVCKGKKGRETSILSKSQSQLQTSYTVNPNPKGGKLKGRASISSIPMANSMDNTGPFFSISDGGDSGISTSVDTPNIIEGESEYHHPHHHHQQQHRQHSRISSSPNVHFEPATVEIHRPVNGVKSALVHKRSANNPPAASSSSPVSSSIEVLSGSSTNSLNSIRIIPSVLPSASGFGTTSRSGGENITLFYTGRATSIATSGQSTSTNTSACGRAPPLSARYRSEISSCRPTLMRQSRVTVDHEIISPAPESDETEEGESNTKSKTKTKNDKGEEIKLVIPEEDSELDDNELEV